MASRVIWKVERLGESNELITLAHQIENSIFHRQTVGNM